MGEFSNGLIKPFAGFAREFHALHDFIGAVALADAGNAADETFGNTVVACARHGHGNPFAVGTEEPVAHMVNGGGGGRGRSVNRGSDLRINVKVTLKDVVHGVTKKFKINRYVACDHCHGTGAKDGTAFHTCATCHGTGVVTRMQRTILGTMQTQSPCPDCHGEGKVISEQCPHCHGEGVERKEEIVTVNIPAGVADGMTLSMSGKGNAARRGGVTGDLLIQVSEEKHPELVRDENDITYNLMLDFPTAVLGGKVEVPTVDGRARVTIEPGTQSGKVLRMRGKGIPSMHGGGCGDELINVMIYTPEHLSAEEKKEIEKMRDSDNFKPSESDKFRIFSRLKHIFD